MIELVIHSDNYCVSVRFQNQTTELGNKLIFFRFRIIIVFRRKRDFRRVIPNDRRK